jgi:ATP synthase protein I
MPGQDNGGPLKGAGMLATAGITLVVSTFVGLAIGVYLDRVFSTRPWLTIIFLVFGVIAGFKNIFTIVKRHGI